MRYFTKELWRLAQNPNAAYEARKAWDAASRAYQEQLAALRSRVPIEAFDFVTEADVHDAELRAVSVLDASRGAPPAEPSRPWISLMPHPVAVKLEILEASDRVFWELEYRQVRRAVIDFPTEDPLFYADGSGFDDLGYHELTDAGDGFLRHELLFSSGSILLVEFKDIGVSKTLRDGRG